MEEINQLVSKGEKAYALFEFEKAVECFGEACGKYSELNNKEDTKLLYLYGRALFKVGVSNSRVLGDQQQEASSRGEQEEENGEEAPKNGLFQFTESQIEEEEAEQEESGKEQESQDGRDNEEEEEGEEEEAEQQDDLEVAWEILDLARTLVTEEIEQQQETEEKEGGSDKTRTLQTRLANIYDLLGDISLEGENFKQAVEDFKTLVKLRKQIEAPTSEYLSEAHYKLSLALEFDVEDENGITSAIDETNKAIDCVKKRIESSGEDAKKAANDKELVDELEQRIKELESKNNLAQEVIQGMLGNIAGSSGSAQKRQADTPSTDISGLVRKKKK